MFGSDLYSVYFDSHGKPRKGEWIFSFNDTENLSSVVSEYLKMGIVSTRCSGSLKYISAKSGAGYIPILAFHKLGDSGNFELRPELFKELLIYLHDNEYHVISDYQYLTENYTFAENGKKLIVLGSDDSSNGTLYYETTGDRKTGTFIMNRGQYILSDDSMVFYLNQYLPKEEGRRNFTFYITFDAIPFRQTGGGYNPGSPYKSMFSVLSKLKYLESNYFIGNHTANHLYSELLTEEKFVEELDSFYQIMISYGINIDNIKTLAYPFGIGEITSEREDTVKSYHFGETFLAGAFDYNGYVAKPISSGDVNSYDVSRIGVDNNSYGNIMTLLKTLDIFKSRRVVILESDAYLFDLSSLDLNQNDLNYILIGS